MGRSNCLSSRDLEKLIILENIELVHRYKERLKNLEINL